MKTLKLYFYTIKDLKLIQIFGRLWFKIYIPSKTIKCDKVSVNKKKISKNSFIKKDNVSFDGKKIFLLNKVIKVNKNFNWDSSNYDKLIRYNLHYFDYINSNIHIDYKKHSIDIIENWLQNNSFINNIGWDSYPTSMRIINWIKFSLLHNYFDYKFIKSLFIQMVWLSQRVEYHLQGNHLITNAKALIFGGLFFNGKKSNEIFKYGIKIFENEIEKQILNDGGHYERSTMYHAIILEDILDILQLLKIYKNKNKLFERKLIAISKKMIVWLSNMSHNDNKISFFNDSTFGIANNINALRKYSKIVTKNYVRSSSEKVSLFKESGFLTFENKYAKLIASVGGITSKEQPGHSHGDNLSFELSLLGKRLIVNSGISTYFYNEDRVLQRSAISHNTLTYKNYNSNDIWSSFRVGRKANVYKDQLMISKNRDCLVASYYHDGFKSIFTNIIHKREWDINKKYFKVTDFINNKKNTSIIRYYFHPSVTLKKNYLIHSGKKFNYSVKGGIFKIKNATWYPGFNKKIKNKCIEIDLFKNFCEFTIYWNN